MKVLLGVTGSVAAIKAPLLASRLIDEGCDVQVVVTEMAKKFTSGWGGGYRVWEDSDEWRGDYKIRHSPVLHIELREWADIFVVAPLSAHTLAKLANGMADNLLTCIMRAWKRSKKIFVAPAMNTEMWIHPATEEHLEKLQKWYPNLHVIQPIEKMLACGTRGMGAMAEVETIVEAVTRKAGS